MRSILLAQGVMLLAVPAWAAEVGVSVDDEIQISTLTEGVEASALVSQSDAKAAVEAQKDAIKACFGDSDEVVDLKYRVAIDVGGDGKVTAVRAVEGVPTPEQTTCIEAALKQVALPPLSKPEATATVTTTVKIVRQAVEQPKPTEVTPVEVPADQSNATATQEPPAQPGVQEATGETPKGTETKVAETVTAPASTPTDAPSKPWSVSANFTQSLGQGTFVDSRYAFYGYAVMLAGSYKIDPKLLSLSARFAWDQELTNSYKSGGTFERELYVRDLSIGASAPELYKDEQYTGIKATAGVGLTFPLSKLSRDQEQILGTRLSVGLSRSFENIGPGTLSLAWTGGLRYNFSPATRTYDQAEWASKYNNCRNVNRAETGDCLTSLANPRWGISNGFNVSYSFLEKFSATVDFQILNNFATALNESEMNERLLTAGVPYDDTHSINANVGRSNQSDVTVFALEFAYSILDNLSVAVGLSTTQSPFIQSDSNSSALRNPFWDFSSQSDNLSTFYLDLAASY